MATVPRAEITETDRLMYAFESWANEQGWPYGVPIPSMGPSEKRLVIAKRAPFGNRERPILSFPEMRGEIIPRELREREECDNWKIINCWYHREGYRVYVVEVPGSAEDHPVWAPKLTGRRVAMVDNHPTIDRFRLIFDTIGARNFSVTARAEARALMNLADRLTRAQADSYILSNAFIETSKRSGVRYVFRKGLPTIALSNNAKFLAALCLHPLAYFEDTHAGSMAPSDDVLAHLLMMRSDEHRFWKEATQHPLWDPRSGI